MAGWFSTPEPPPGVRPGTLTVVPEAAPTRITLLSYRADDVQERRIADPDEIGELDEDRVYWIHVQGLGDPAVLESLLGRELELHPLTVEDILTTPQRPKAEWMQQRALIILRAPYVDADGDVEVEQVSLVVGDRYVLSVEEQSSGRFQPVWDRLMQGLGPIRSQGADYLAYALLDASIDAFFPVLEMLGDRLEELEVEAMESPTEATLIRTNRVRNSLVILRRVIWPQREALQMLLRNDAGLFAAETGAYLRDAYEHCLQVSEIIESYRDLVGAVNNTYLSAVSNRTNEVMRVLTIMSSLFIPLTFIAGIYGMNFEYIPELGFRYGYFVVWAVMLIITAFMLLFFVRRGWIGGGSKRDGAE
ncbi:MAG: magnesium/cobalt transporter CorA [Acidobacteria bacterium]|nr:magnesium/cobalt transporter CorA [Acidobacteriota bacterium]